MNYIETYRALVSAEATGAMYVTIEVDGSVVTVSLEDALNHIEGLPTGESFQIHLTHYSDTFV